MPKDIKSINDILNNEPAFTNFLSAVKENDVVDKFSEIFPDLSQIAKALIVKRGCLYLEVENSVWKSELNLKKNIIVDRINKFFNEKLIHTIRFK